jgi:hypothetical protein
LHLPPLVATLFIISQTFTLAVAIKLFSSVGAVTLATDVDPDEHLRRFPV